MLRVTTTNSSPGLGGASSDVSMQPNGNPVSKKNDKTTRYIGKLYGFLMGGDTVSGDDLSFREFDQALFWTLGIHAGRSPRYTRSAHKIRNP